MIDDSEILKKRGRPPCDSRFEPYFQNIAMWGAIRTLAGGPRHASTEKKPRPLPTISLYDHKQRLYATFMSEEGPIPEAVSYVFYADKYRSSPEKAVALPSEHLWWLAAPQDDLLLSDRITHHYTTVAQVDRAEERIYFHDEWPEDFFLLKGRNTIGAAARLDKGLSISKSEFLKAVVGLVTLDTPALIEHYFAAFSERRRNPDTLLRFGLTLLDAEKESLLALLTSGYLLEALQLAELAGDSKIAALAASKAYVAMVCGAYGATIARDIGP